MADSDHLSQSVASYSAPLPPAAATLPEGLLAAFKLHGKTGWVLLIGTLL